ncbi:12740_t:CDS:2, partial [Funneliformis geosporum]
MDDHNLLDTSISVNDNCVNVKDFQTEISGAVTAAHENDDSDSDGNDTNDFTELKETKL